MQNVTEPFGNLYIKTKLSLHRLSKWFKYNKKNTDHITLRTNIYIYNIWTDTKKIEKKKMWNWLERLHLTRSKALLVVN